VPLQSFELTVRRAIFWTLSAFFLALAVWVKDGTYAPSAIVGLSLAIVLAVAGVYCPALPSRLPSTTQTLNAILIGCATAFTALWGVPRESPNAPYLFVSYWCACLFLAVLLSRLVRGPLARWLFPLFLLAHIGLGTVTIMGAKVDEKQSGRFKFEVRNDVQIFADEAARLLTEGKNPYSTRMPNVMGADLPFYWDGATDKNGRLPFGYPYMPLSAIFSIPGYLLGDIRLANAFAIIGIAFCLAYARPSVTSQLAATVFLLFPSTLLMLIMSWTEPVALFFLAATVFCSFRAPKWLFLALGCLIASKQYTLFLLPLLPLVFPDKAKWRPLLWQSLGVAALLTVPMALWDIDGFYRSVVQMQFKQPFRRDSLSYFVTVLRAGGPQLSPLLGFAALIAGLSFGALKAPRTAAGWLTAGAVAYLGFFALNKQAFVNYYFWVFGLLITAVAVALPSHETSGEGVNGTVEPVPIR
jgi:hypothetical protein